MQGTIAKVVVDRGYGFIKRDDRKPDVFFHVRDVELPGLAFDERLTELRVAFDVVTDADGRTRAKHVKFAR